MGQARLGARYAKSLFSLAKDLGTLEEVYQDMLFISSTCKDNKELVLIIDSPVVPSAKKEKIFHYLFQDVIQSTSMQFFDIIFNKGREMYIDDIAHAFVDIYKKFKHIEKAQLVTASVISDSFKQRIIHYLEKKCPGQSIELEHKIDPSLIGGFIINYSGLQLDKSTKSELDFIEQNFSKNLYLKDF